MKIMSKLFMLVLAISSALLSGCQSEVDKCVDAQLLAWKEKSKIKKDVLSDAMKNGKPTLGEIFDLIPDKLESEVKAEARLNCLKAAK